MAAPGPGWWADTVGEHFGEWTAALAFVRDLGFPNEAKAWPITHLSTGERLRLALVHERSHSGRYGAPPLDPRPCRRGH